MSQTSARATAPAVPHRSKTKIASYTFVVTTCYLIVHFWTLSAVSQAESGDVLTAASGTPAALAPTRQPTSQQYAPVIENVLPALMEGQQLSWRVQNENLAALQMVPRRSPIAMGAAALPPIEHVQGGVCLNLNELPASSAMFGDSQYSHLVGSPIFFIHTSEETELAPANECAVSTAAARNPNKPVVFLSNTIPCHYFQPFANGYAFPQANNLDNTTSGRKSGTLTNIFVVRFDYEAFFSFFPGVAEWYAERAWKKGNVLNNLSNIMRLCLLHRFGGAYFDMDVLSLRGLDEGQNAIALESPEFINSAVLMFTPQHGYVERLIAEFLATFNGAAWGWNGPKLLTRVWRDMCGPDCGDVELLATREFYPITAGKAPWLLEAYNPEEDAAKLQHYLSLGPVAHLWNRVLKVYRRKIRTSNTTVLDVMLHSMCPSPSSANEEEGEDVEAGMPTISISAGARKVRKIANTSVCSQCLSAFKTRNTSICASSDTSRHPFVQRMKGIVPRSTTMAVSWNTWQTCFHGFPHVTSSVQPWLLWSGPSLYMDAFAVAAAKFGAGALRNDAGDDVAITRAFQHPMLGSSVWASDNNANSNLGLAVVSCRDDPPPKLPLHPVAMSVDYSPYAAEASTSTASQDKYFAVSARLRTSLDTFAWCARGAEQEAPGSRVDEYTIFVYIHNNTLRLHFNGLELLEREVKLEHEVWYHAVLNFVVTREDKQFAVRTRLILDALEFAPIHRVYSSTEPKYIAFGTGGAQPSSCLVHLDRVVVFRGNPSVTDITTYRTAQREMHT